MKIGIDGFALSFSRGTGITRYGLELSRMLLERNHKVTALFALNGIGLDRTLHWPRFIQSLTLKGEAAPRDVRRWGYYCALYFPKYLAGFPIKATPIVKDIRINASSLEARLPPFESYYNAPSVYRVAQAYSYFFNRTLQISLGEKIDVWHTTMPIPVTVAGAKSVVTAHDMIPITLPQSTAINLRHYRRILWHSLSAADLIFAVSEHTKRDLLCHFDLPKDKIFVTHLSVEVPARFVNADPSQVSTVLQRRFGLAAGNYFLFYGAIEPKKNVRRIVQAMEIAKTNMPVVIVGGKGWLNEDVLELLNRSVVRAKDDRRVHCLDYLPFENLMWLLKGARGLLFPSLAEGFGIPLLEAMQMGCPVITSKTTPQTEVCGDAAIYVDPLNVGEIALTIDLLASDEPLHKELANRGKVQAQRFSPDRYMARVEEGYSIALSS
jgi:glycosyltransferase involved in cell wall biosynthesis